MALAAANILENIEKVSSNIEEDQGSQDATGNAKDNAAQDTASAYKILKTASAKKASAQRREESTKEAVS